MPRFVKEIYNLKYHEHFFVEIRYYFLGGSKMIHTFLDNFWSWAIAYIRSLKKSRLTPGENRDEVGIGNFFHTCMQ
jgi:hypothetical protein